ncbi:Adhesion G-protein coupled receptor G7, partial [Frankliniella fusca]
GDRGRSAGAGRAVPVPGLRRAPLILLGCLLQVVIVGAALALVAQFLCLASAVRRLRPGRADVATAVLFNVELALIVENLVFMLGVQSVGEPLRCRWVALALHYLHLVAAGWFLANTAFLSYRLRARLLPAHFKPVAVTVWALPAVMV